MKKIICFFCLIIAFRAFSANTNIDSPFTDIIDHFSFKDLEAYSSKISPIRNMLALNCYKNSSDKYYIGLFHGVIINDSLQNTAAILDDFAEYPHVFKGVEESSVVKKIDSDHFIVQFEDKAPVFFLPNPRYQMIYSIEKKANFQIYRYHLSSLLKQNDIRYSDGLIYLKEDHGKTFYYELDFFNARWGVAEKIASSKIWPETIKELVLSDFELKMKVENKALKLSEIVKDAEKMLDDNDLKNCIESAGDQKEFFKSSH